MRRKLWLRYWPWLRHRLWPIVLRPTLWRVVFILVLWGGALGIGLLVVEWRDTEKDAPARRLSVTQAVELVQDYLRSGEFNGGTVEFILCGDLPSERGFPDESPQFNAPANRWIVPCMGQFMETGATESSYFRERYLTDPVTGQVTPIP